MCPARCRSIEHNSLPSLTFRYGCPTCAARHIGASGSRPPSTSMFSLILEKQFFSQQPGRCCGSSSPHASAIAVYSGLISSSVVLTSGGPTSTFSVAGTSTSVGFDALSRGMRESGCESFVGPSPTVRLACTLGWAPGDSQA